MLSSVRAHAAPLSQVAASMPATSWSKAAVLPAGGIAVLSQLSSWEDLLNLPLSLCQ